MWPVTCGQVAFNRKEGYHKRGKKNGKQPSKEKPADPFLTHSNILGFFGRIGLLKKHNFQKKP